MRLLQACYRQKSVEFYIWAIDLLDSQVSNVMFHESAINFWSFSDPCNVTLKELSKFKFHR